MRLKLFLNVNFIIILINWDEDISITNHIDYIKLIVNINIISLLLKHCLLITLTFWVKAVDLTIRPNQATWCKIHI